jgi:DNA phosphorothioation-dependent restriction protein DptH
VVHHFPEELEERLSYLGESFINTHFHTESGEQWRDLDMQVLWEEIDRQKQHALDFAAATADTCRLIGPRNKSDTAAGKREKHLMLLADAQSSTFDLRLVFHGDDLDLDQFRISNNKVFEERAALDIRRTRGRRTVILTGPFSGQPLYFTLRLRRPSNSECYTFHVVVLRDGEFYTPAFENQFLVTNGVSRLQTNKR